MPVGPFAVRAEPTVGQYFLFVDEPDGLALHPGPVDYQSTSTVQMLGSGSPKTQYTMKSPPGDQRGQ